MKIFCIVYQCIVNLWYSWPNWSVIFKLNIFLCFIILFAAAGNTCIIPFTTICALLQSHKSDLSVRVLDLLFFLMEYWQPDNHILQSIFLPQTFIQLNLLMPSIFYSIPFYYTWLNLFSMSCLFSNGKTISSTFLKFMLDIGFGFIIFSAVLFPLNSPADLPVLWTSFLEAILTVTSFVFVAVCHKLFPIC